MDLKELSRKDIIQKSLDNYGYILVADTMQDAIDTVNEIASEHLEVVTANPFDTMTRIQNAGAIFMEVILPSHLAIILPDQITCFRRTELQSSSHHFR